MGKRKNRLCALASPMMTYDELFELVCRLSSVESVKDSFYTDPLIKINNRITSKVTFDKIAESIQNGLIAAQLGQNSPNKLLSYFPSRRA